MTRWNAAVTVANSQSLAAGTPETGDISDLRNPTVLVKLEDLEGAADDTAIVRVVGDAATYEIDSRTLSGPGSYPVEVPQAATVEFESSNGVTYSVEVRGDPT